eukprot:18780-Heterococcus_DN1.PRE.2
MTSGYVRFPFILTSASRPTTHAWFEHLPWLQTRMQQPREVQEVKRAQPACFKRRFLKTSHKALVFGSFIHLSSGSALLGTARLTLETSKIFHLSEIDSKSLGAGAGCSVA